MFKESKKEKHIFAFYVQFLDKVLGYQKNNSLLDIQDENLLHRVRDVLRMKEEEFCYLFNQMQHILVKILFFDKKGIRFLIQGYGKNCSFKPDIRLFLPILKRSNLEDAVYNATECGVSSIRLIKTAKTAKNISNHECERLEKIIIAAAEQAKQFHLPDLLLPVCIDDVLRDTGVTKKIWFDKEGGSYFDLLETLRVIKPEQINILIGPEGDFTEQERITIINAGFESYTLTPTTLRSVSAVSVAIGSLRALLSVVFFVLYI